MIIGSLLLLLNVALIVPGLFFVALSRPRTLPHPTCGACNYDVCGSLHFPYQCPECGAGLGAVGMEGRRARYSRLHFQLGIVLVAIPVLCDIALVAWMLVVAGVALYDAIVA